VATATTRKWLGAAGGERKDFVVTLFVPSVTRDGIPLDHAAWRARALETMARLFGGATAMEGEGAWRDDGRGGEIKLEKISTVDSFMARSSWNGKTVSEFGKFLQKMRRETNQGAIGLSVDGEYFSIEEFS